MKKVISFSALLLTLAAMLFAVGCKKDENSDQPDVNSVGTFTQADVVKAVSQMYTKWEDDTTIPETVAVGSASLTTAQFQYALCKAFTNMVAGKSDDIVVINCKAATHPERDSYDQETIAIKDGAKNGTETEDLNNVATRMITRMTEDGQVPNQTLFTRGTESIAFSTNRATVSMARAIAEYVSTGKIPATVSTEYLSAAATLLGFAKEFVSYLDVWKNTTGDVDADGSHCTSNKSAWTNVHFIPIPYSGGYSDGTMYSDKYQPYHTITVAGVTYDAAQCWEIALKGILDLVTKEGSGVMQEKRNVLVHTLGDGKAMSEPIPTVDTWAAWGTYPFYEKADDPCAINFSPANPCTLGFLQNVIPWFLTRASQLTHIGNFQTFNADDPDKSLVYGAYKGNISPMRVFLIAARFYKYILDNKITTNVYSAMKDVALDYDLYGVEQPGVTLISNNVSFETAGGDKEVEFTPTVAWTATTAASWLKINPASGSATVTKITITADPNTGAARTDSVIITAGKTKATIKVSQAEKPQATIEAFAKEYVKILDIWQKNTATINFLTGEAAGDAANDVKDAHYVPSTTTITVAGQTFTTADMLETAERAYLLLRGYDGNATGVSGAGKFEKTTTQTKITDMVPATHSYVWNTTPFNESGSTAVGNVVTGNGGHLRMGDPKTADGVACQVKLDILDNFAQRHVNYGITRKGLISNMCGYASSQLAGYYGTFCAQRALLTYAFFFKYMLDNKLADATGISADQIFRSEEFGDESTTAPKNTLMEFAKQVVSYLDVWKATVDTVDADGSHCTANKNAWIDVHFIPIPTSGGYKDVPMYKAKYQPYHTITVDGVTYDAAQCWEIALKGILDVITKEGSGVSQVTRNVLVHSLGDGQPMSETIPTIDTWAKWGTYPFYEKDDAPCVINFSDTNPCTLEFLQNVVPWFLTRAAALKHLGNFQTFNPDDESVLHYGTYKGNISAMRMFLISVRFYKYIVDNNITTNVYTAMKDVKLDYDLYGTK